MPSSHPPEGEPFRPIEYTSDVFPTERVDVRDRLVPHQTAGRARRSKQSHARRSWYHPRPQPRRRADLMGFNAVMWLLVLVLVVLLLLWF
jgi:hypothetical protein